MKNLVLILLLLTCTGLAEGTYTHSESGLSFPQRLGTATQTEVIDMSTEGGGTAVAYNDKAADIILYVYPMRASLEQETQLVDDAIRTTWERHGAAVKKLVSRKTKQGQFQGRQLGFQVTREGRKFYSQARIYDLGEYRFKMRLTGAWKDKGKIERLAALTVRKVLSGR